MKKDRTAVMAVAILGAGLLVGGTGGAIATGQVGTGQVQHGATASSTLDHGGVSARGSAARIRGAKVTQYIADGGLLDTQNSVVVRLPGTWNARKLAQSSWSVELIRNGPPSYMFALGQSAPAGESTNNGFYIFVNNNGRADVQINAESYNVIDTIRVVRTERTGANNSTNVTRQAARTSGAGG